jgi:hypothetical protein
LLLYIRLWVKTAALSSESVFIITCAAVSYQAVYGNVDKAVIFPKTTSFILNYRVNGESTRRNIKNGVYFNNHVWTW